MMLYTGYTGKAECPEGRIKRRSVRGRETKLHRRPEERRDRRTGTRNVRNGTEGNEVTEYDVGVRTWLQLMCCALASGNRSP